MLRVEVLSLDGAAPTQPIAASFGPQGGTIGRGDQNAMVLPDATRTLSKVHAQVLARKDGYRLIARGSNPLVIDQTVLEMGEELLIEAEMRVQMGTCLLLLTPPSNPGSRLPDDFEV